MKKYISALMAAIVILSTVFLCSCYNPIYAKTKTFAADSWDGTTVLVKVPRNITLNISNLPGYGDQNGITSFLSDLPFSEIVEKVKAENPDLKCEWTGTDRVLLTDSEGKTIMMRILYIHPDSDGEKLPLYTEGIFLEADESLILTDGISTEGVEGRDGKQINFVPMKAVCYGYKVPFPMHMSGPWIGSTQVHTLIASKEEFMKFYEDLPYELEMTDDGFIMKDYTPKGNDKKISVQFIFTEDNGQTKVELKKV